jgi:SSS family solute:Na+ symporter
MKYFMAILIIVPGIALAVLLKDNGLADPDETFPYLVNEFLGPGVKGVIVCALFASLMSTVDSTFNSLSTLFTIDIYQPYINPNATDKQLVAVGRKVILVTLFTGVAIGILLIHVKFSNPENAFTHLLNELRYYINCGIVVLICTAAFLLTPNRKVVLAAFLLTIPLQITFKYFLPEMNYFVRAGWVIVIPLCIIFISILKEGSIRSPKEWFVFANDRIKWAGIGLALSLGVLHYVFH